MVLLVLWSAYCALHSLLAATDFKKWLEKKWLKAYRYYRLFYTLFAAAGLGGILVYQFSISSALIFHERLAGLIAGIIITLGGGIIMGICILKYFIRLSGMFRAIHDTRDDVLMITGIHTMVRHPLYLGTFAFIWGLFILFPTYAILIMNCVITVYTLIAVRFEEKKLVAQFGESYRQYQQKTPMIIPGF